MTSGALLAVVVASWVIPLALLTAVVVQLRRDRSRQESRADQELARLRTEVAALSAQLTALTAAESSEPQLARASSRSDKSGEEAPEDVPLITGIAESDSGDEVDLSAARVASVTLAGPLIKVAALSFGVRRALHEDSRMRISHAVRKELRQQRKMRRRRRTHQRPSEGWVR